MDLDRFETILSDGLVKLCNGAGVFQGGIMSSPDFDTLWDESYLKDYTADAVENFNAFPEAAIAWAAYLGMAVAHNWDADWNAHRNDAYSSYYGSRGWDDMDERTVHELLHLKADWAAKIADTLDSCALATLGLIRHEGIEAQTADGFYVLVRAYTVMFRIGVTIELQRLGYTKVVLKPGEIPS